MTPLELIILFNSYILVFILVWLTNSTEQVETCKGNTAGCKSSEHLVESKEIESPPSWNVAAFFGFKDNLKKRSL